MARMGKRATFAVAAVAFVLAVGAVVVVQAPGGLSGLLGSVAPEDRADQVLAGIKAENTYLALMEERRPDVYAELRQVLTAAAANGDPVMRMANDGRRVLAEWLVEAIATAPDPVALEMLAVTRGQFAELLETNPQMCAAMATGQEFGDIAPYVSAELRAREQQVYEMLLSAPAEPVVVLPEEELQAAYRQISPDLENRFGADLALMEAGVVEEADSAKVCAMQVAILEAIEGLAPQRAAAVARAMLAGS